MILVTGLASLSCGQEAPDEAEGTAAPDTAMPTVMSTDFVETFGDHADAAAAGERHGGWRLADSDSPYLRQHADNAVDWYPWGPAAFAAAQERDLPILLSIGYSTCHWCHVMERESFEDADIAALMRAHYIAIKVDREERPDIDERYMAYVQATTGSGGWPMTVVLTPEGKPFFGGTYFPPEDGFGRPGFPRLLTALAAAWSDDRAGVLAAAEQAHDIITADLLPPEGEWRRQDVLDAAAQQFTRGLDPVDGGWRGDATSPKFPPSPALSFLLRRHATTGEPLPASVAVTLDAMAARGLRDHVGGGFHRYCVDGRWQVPHFEKMLYDNAQLVALYAEAAAITGEARWARVARDTLAWVLTDMRSPEGLFYSARDADSRPFVSEAVTGGAAGIPESSEHVHPEEGLFYLWTPGELEVVLGESDGARFAALYDVTAAGNFEDGRSIVRPGITVAQMAAASDDPAAFVAWLDDARARLAAARSHRPPAFRDEKCLAAWNGLMLSGLASAAVSLDDDELRAATAAAAAAIVEQFELQAVAATEATLAHQIFEGRKSGTGDLSDHAFLARGLLDASLATGDESLADLSLGLTRRLADHFEDGEHGGFFTTVGDDPLLPGQSRELNDGAVPAGTSITIELLRRLSARDRRGRLSTASERALARLGPLLAQRARSWPALVLALQFETAADAAAPAPAEPTTPAR